MQHFPFDLTVYSSRECVSLGSLVPAGVPPQAMMSALA